MLREGNLMKSLLVMAKLRREPTDHDSSPIVEHRANPAGIDEALAFGRFRVLLRQRRLLANGAMVELGPRAFDILLVLIEADGALVTKDELQSRVWGAIVVTQDNVKVQISALRKALGEDRDLIRTEHGHGYRFTAAVRSTVPLPQCLPAPGATTPQDGWRAALTMELAVIASQVTDLEMRLAEALDQLGAHSNTSRFRRRRYLVVHSSRRTRRGRPVDPVWRGTALPEKPLDLLC